MSEMGQSRRFGDVQGISALPLIADVCCEDRQVEPSSDPDDAVWPRSNPARLAGAARHGSNRGAREGLELL
jgi:hypothetical protein